MPDRNATSNTLIAAMDEETAWAVLDASERVDLERRQQLHVYFLESGIASIVANAPGGLEIETGIVGKEGMVGTTALAGINQSPHEIFVQIAATARRVPVAQMRSLINGSPPLQQLLIRYLEPSMCRLRVRRWQTGGQQLFSGWLAGCSCVRTGSKVPDWH